MTKFWNPDREIKDIEEVWTDYLTEHGDGDDLDKSTIATAHGDLPGVVIFGGAEELVDEFGDIQMTIERAKLLIEQLQAAIQEDEELVRPTYS